MSDTHPFGPGSHAPLADESEMPACYPIKGNADSMKYHRPDSSGYDVTGAEVWFVSPSYAEAAGFTLAGSHPQGSSSADYEPGAANHPCSAQQITDLGIGAPGIGVDDDETVSSDAAAGIRETAKMATAGAAGGVAAAADDAEAAAAQAATTPYGPGSHVPLADVHEMPACHPVGGRGCWLCSCWFAS